MSLVIFVIGMIQSKTVLQQLSVKNRLDHNDPLNSSHCLTDGWHPLTTLETNGNMIDQM